MKIDKFLEISDKDLLKKRIEYEKQLKQTADHARKTFFSYKSHRNYLKYMKAKADLRKATFT